MSKATLYPHQVEAVQQAAKRFKSGGRGFYLNHSPGLGKTLTTIILARALGFRLIGVIGPVASLEVWRKQLQQWWPQSRGAIIRNNQGTSWNWFNSSESDWHIANYEQVRDNATVRQRFLNIADADRSKLDLLVLDEGHAIKSVSTSTTKEILKIAPKFQRILILSGTPAHSPLDWYSPFKLIAPEDSYWSGQTFTAYKRRIAYLGGPNNNWVNTRLGDRGFIPDEKAEAARHILPYCHVATSDQLKVPEPIWSPVTFPLPEEEQCVYRQMDKTLEVDFGDGSVSSADLVITKLLRLHQITGGHLTDELGAHHRVGKTKLQTLRGLLDERQHQKIIIACRFRWEIDAIANLVGFREGSLGKIRPGSVLPDGSTAEARLTALTITGDTPPEERGRIEDLFQTSPHPIALILQYRAGGVSLTFTKADCVIYYSFEPSVIAWRQMIGRTWRIGQMGHVQMIPLMAENTVDERMYRGLCLGLDGVDLARYALQGGS